MLAHVLRPLAWMPLSWLQAMGAVVGRLAYGVSRGYSARLDQNLRQSGLFGREAEYKRLRRVAAAEAGKTALESLAIWLGSSQRIGGWIREVLGRASVDEARAAGRGVLLLTPHLGCFEVAGFYFGQMMPLTILYRPPRARWLEPLMVAGRARGQAQLATTDLRGVRRLLQALRRSEAVGMLPDQAPRFGEGAWAPFFGRPAFTMTLAARLQQTTGCAAFMVFAERLPRGQGFRLHIEPLDAIENEAALNRAVERMIALAPEQYLWGYNRYKAPADAPPAPAQEDVPVSGRGLGS
jgi:KDO2-lipid IV(A) lauroyltransferase